MSPDLDDFDSDTRSGTPDIGADEVSGNAWTRYFYEGAHCIEETDSGGDTEMTYVYGAGIDRILSMQVDSTGDDYFYLTNSIGSVTAVLDNSGDVVEKYEYAAFGGFVMFDGDNNLITSSAIGNEFLFQGRRFDSETCLYYFRARMYDHSTGRFLSHDPLGYKDSMSMYQAFGGNPVNVVDPMGECGDWIIRGFVAYKAIKKAVKKAVKTVNEIKKRKIMRFIRHITYPWHIFKNSMKDAISDRDKVESFWDIFEYRLALAAGIEDMMRRKSASDSSTSEGKVYGPPAPRPSTSFFDHRAPGREVELPKMDPSGGWYTDRGYFHPSMPPGVFGNWGRAENWRFAQMSNLLELEKYTGISTGFASVYDYDRMMTELLLGRIDPKRDWPDFFGKKGSVCRNDKCRQNNEFTVDDAVRRGFESFHTGRGIEK